MCDAAENGPSKVFHQPPTPADPSGTPEVTLDGGSGSALLNLLLKRLFGLPDHPAEIDTVASLPKSELTFYEFENLPSKQQK